MRITKNYLFDNHVAFYCETRYIADMFALELESIGVDWGNNERFVGNTNYSTYGTETCYCFQSGYMTYANYEYYRDNYFEIIHVSKILKPYRTKRLVKELFDI